MTVSLCYRFTLGDRAWQIDLMTLSLNDWILLQEFSGRTRAQLLTGLEGEEAISLKVVWWAARRASGEDVTLDSDEMNPVWGADFTVQRIPHLSEAAEESPVTPAARSAAKKPAKK
ncbi:hypothetical protein C8D88_116146 [Lentzea atacamensis]|uniref:Uncharacterized protein n=1 Tax=Lentzea atacamensis TaxID=531938 RepID=A0A316HN39_9PSEU|nr:hypothetical protein [Lentzea atacamensis]PWK81734.1 hypothetical protein C8D88_116146 [Lentzea atacamensis]